MTAPAEQPITNNANTVNHSIFGSNFNARQIVLKFFNGVPGDLHSLQPAAHTAQLRQSVEVRATRTALLLARLKEAIESHQHQSKLSEQFQQTLTTFDNWYGSFLDIKEVPVVDVGILKHINDHTNRLTEQLKTATPEELLSSIKDLHAAVITLTESNSLPENENTTSEEVEDTAYPTYEELLRQNPRFARGDAAERAGSAPARPSRVPEHDQVRPGNFYAGARVTGSAKVIAGDMIDASAVNRDAALQMPRRHEYGFIEVGDTASVVLGTVTRAVNSERPIFPDINQNVNTDAAQVSASVDANALRRRATDADVKNLRFAGYSQLWKQYLTPLFPKRKLEAVIQETTN